MRVFENILAAHFSSRSTFRRVGRWSLYICSDQFLWIVGGRESFNQILILRRRWTEGGCESCRCGQAKVPFQLRQATKFVRVRCLSSEPGRPLRNTSRVSCCLVPFLSLKDLSIPVSKMLLRGFSLSTSSPCWGQLDSDGVCANRRLSCSGTCQVQRREGRRFNAVV